MRALAGRVRSLLQAGASPDLGAPLEAVPFAVIGTELTGLDLRRDAVVSLGAVLMTGTRIALAPTFSRRLAPAPGAGIAEAAAALREFCGGRVVAAHFLSLDLAFLARDAEAFRAADLRRRGVDTAALEDWLAGGGRPGGGNRTLAATARRRGLPVPERRDILRDAFLTAQLLQRQLRDLPDRGVRTLGDLLKAGKP